jgi:hypothetical protein
MFKGLNYLKLEDVAGNLFSMVCNGILLEACDPNIA